MSSPTLKYLCAAKVSFNFVADQCTHVSYNKYTFHNSIGYTKKCLDVFEGHFPLAPGVCQAPHFTYCQHSITSAATTNSTRCMPHQTPQYTHIPNTCQAYPALTALDAC